MTNLNGAPIIHRCETALYVRIPYEMALPCDGGCHCEYCKAHPNLTPKWDTLCLPLQVKKPSDNYAFTVHMPEACGKSTQAGRRV